MSGLKQSWGQTFVPTCDDPITVISFNAATAVNSSFTLTIRDGADCNATILHTQIINSIVDGNNVIYLSMPVPVIGGNTYYFVVETNGTTTWKVRYSNTSKVAGNLKTHQPTSLKSACDLDWPNYDMSFSINAEPVCSILSKGTTVSAVLSQSWGQSFVTPCSKQIQYIVFNSATDVKSKATLTIRKGLDCNATVIHTQTIDSINDGDNKVILSAPVSVMADSAYYFSVENSASSTWKVRYNSASPVAGNMKTHKATSPKTACDWDFPNYDWAFSIDTIIPSYPFPELSQQVDLFILGGQSNALGAKGNGAFYPTDTLNLDKSIGLNYTRVGITSSFGKWITMQTQNTPDFVAGNFGPEVSFGRRLKAAGYNPAIFKFTKGGTSINSFWKTPGDGGQYDALVTTLKTAINDLENKGFIVNPRAFIWIQGEADAANDSIANLYYGKLLSIVKDIRTNVVKNNNLPIILGVDEQFSTRVSVIVSAQQKIANEESNIRFTSMIGLEKADYTHLTPAGLYPHGIRLFDAFQDLMKATTEIHNPLNDKCIISVFDKTLHISTQENIVDVQLFDCTGRLVVNQKTSNGSLPLDLKQGFYIVAVKIDGQLIAKKIII